MQTQSKEEAKDQDEQGNHGIIFSAISALTKGSDGFSILCTSADLEGDSGLVSPPTPGKSQVTIGFLKHSDTNLHREAYRLGSNVGLNILYFSDSN